ncbi:MAG: hypothetical protein BAJALOKI1v1_30001 [Promethearchaeota archaeon]|nr:MAG: hypothetical protein BAJALOKI1v1_30001 [Candidatus Lokiarchaeota archaeon]
MEKKIKNQQFKIDNEISTEIKEYLDNYPFLIIIGKYDHVLGPKALFSPITFDNDRFVKNLLRDALNTKNKFVILNYYNFYSQICKVEIKDLEARGQKQLYAIILLRHSSLPLIPILHFKRMEMIFRKIGENTILADDPEVFNSYFKAIQKIYIDRAEMTPLEAFQLKIRSGINTIQGFCELIYEEKKEAGTIAENTVLNYIQLMLDSCDDIIKALETDLNKSLQG